MAYCRKSSCWPLHPDLPAHLGRVRDLATAFHAGGTAAFEPFREYVSFILGRTVMRSGGFVYFRSTETGVKVLSGPRGLLDPVPLNDGRYLRITAGAYIDPEHNNFLKISNSAYQYQHDEAGNEWILRYDYIRVPRNQHPACHLQINGELAYPVDAKPLGRIHFPTRRMSLEAVIRLLADQFGVPCNDDAEVWRGVLAEGEELFRDIAHDPPPGPRE